MLVACLLAFYRSHFSYVATLAALVRVRLFLVHSTRRRFQQSMMEAIERLSVRSKARIRFLCERVCGLGKSGLPARC